MLEDATADPVFAVMLRPSNRAKPGGVFAQDPGKIQGDNIPLKNVIAYAYSVGARHLEGPEPLLNAHYDFCVLLPGGATGDTDLLRDMLERSFKLKIRREPRQVDAAVLKISGPKPAEFAGSLPISTLVGILESRLNRFVLNETGLDGRYKFFELPEKEEDLRNSLRSELGIEMSFERRSVDILVIDSMELPTYRVSLPGR
jgi:hypothetical protein